LYLSFVQGDKNGSICILLYAAYQLNSPGNCEGERGVIEKKKDRAGSGMERDRREVQRVRRMNRYL
jgi:hypothetical protein